MCSAMFRTACAAGLARVAISVSRPALRNARPNANAPALQRLICGLKPLAFPPVRGWLTGFIDLIFRFEERFYIIDWKSNRLGLDPAAYGPENVQLEMDAHHYPLQAHLYAVALHRYLAQRLPGYDYEKHFGGMTYLFVRGMNPATPHLGVWHRRPEEAELEGLSHWLATGR